MWRASTEGAGESVSHREASITREATPWGDDEGMKVTATSGGQPQCAVMSASIPSSPNVAG